MRAGLCLVAAGLLLSGCASNGLTGFLGGSPAQKEATSGSAPPAAGRPPAQNARDNDNNCVVWEKNAYHYECDPYANY
jgi:hypothetical protein